MGGSDAMALSVKMPGALRNLQVAEELIEAVVGGQVLVAVTLQPCNSRQWQDGLGCRIACRGDEPSKDLKAVQALSCGYHVCDAKCTCSNCSVWFGRRSFVMHVHGCKQAKPFAPLNRQKNANRATFDPMFDQPAVGSTT